MKKLSAIILIILIMSLLQACTTIQQTIYLQNVEINGPIKAPPINITKDKKNEQASISVGMSINSNKNIQGSIGTHSKVNSSGIFQVDTLTFNGQRNYKDSGNNNFDFKGNNFQWNQPDFSLFLNSDFKISNIFALSLGFNYSVQGQIDLLGGNFGIGNFHESNNGALRIDIGLNWQQVSYDASSVVLTDITHTGGTESSVIFFEDIGKKTYFNPYFSFIYNSKYEESLINFFLSAGYFTQTIIDYSPSTPSTTYYPFGITIITVDKRGKATAGFINIVPGIYTNLSSNSRLNIGIRFLKETQIESLSSSFFIMPVLQFDVTL